ncbi:MAG: 3'-5' exonuclease [Spirochaetota bacterium]
MVLGELFAEFHTVQRILSFENGERIFTNYMHISELIHAELSKRFRGPDALLSWMDTWKDDIRDIEQRQIRMESDEKAVKIITMHSSKGLQFPVVFCPFLHHPSVPSEKQFMDNALFYHDDAGHMVCEFAPEKGSSGHMKAATELLSENIRLLYVAITRAQYSCFVYYGNMENSATSALSYLLFREIPGGDAAVPELMRRQAEIESADIPSKIRQIMPGNECAINAITGESGQTRLPFQEKEPDLSARTCSARIDRTFRITSYSYLTSQTDVQETHDLSPAGVAFPAGSTDLPPGARSGLLIHDLFERISFADTRERIREHVLCSLAQHGYDESFADHVCTVIFSTLQLTLPQCGIRLSSLSDENCVKEAEFYLATGTYTPKRIMNTVQNWYPLYASNRFLQSDARLSGFLKGYIDLVFSHNGTYYIADWKSNYLGSKSIAYTKESVETAMYEHGYHIQYLLYLVALRRMLALRGLASDSSIGGVYYIFVRGAGEGAAPVFFDRPSERCLDELEEALG